MIVGASFPKEDNSETPASQLTQRKLLDIGGAERHKLSVAELPSHNHGNGKANYLIQSKGKKITRGINKEPTTGYRYSDINALGGNRTHNNMPPFIALYYCPKM